MKKNNIYIFYHICLLNDYESIVNEQLNRLKTSGLLKESTKLFIGIIGPNADNFAEKIKKYSKKIEIIYSSENVQEYEFPTLKYLHSFCQELNNDTTVLYFHTKGVSYTAGKRKNNASDWRHMMEFFLIDNFKHCLEQLEHYDLCGTNWINNNSEHPHFRGNFWWVRAAYIKTLPEIEHQRFKAESWIGTGQPEKVYNIYTSTVNHYLDPLPEEKYKDHFKTVNIAYFILNQPWYQFAQQNKINDISMPEILIYKDQELLKYLKNSLITLKHTNDYPLTKITIWIAELDENTISDFQNKIEKIINSVYQNKKAYEIKIIGKKYLNPLIRQMIKNSEIGQKYSYTSLHEYCLYTIMLNTTDPFLLITDTDVLFLKKGLINKYLKHIQHNKFIAAFYEKERAISFENKKFIRKRKLHSFFIMFNLISFKKEVSIDKELKNFFNIKKRVLEIKNKHLVKHYLEQSSVYDTFSFLTHYLENNFKKNYVYDIEKTAKDDFFSDTQITILLGCEYLLHGKYLNIDILNLILKLAPPIVLNKLIAAFSLIKYYTTGCNNGDVNCEQPRQRERHVLS